MASALCLACSSSLPPRSHAHEVFVTPCCGRPICPTCLKSNPRLARYDPCLACLGGVDAVASSRSQRPNNITGAVRDEDTYVIGEDDEDPDSDPSSDGRRSTPPPVYQAEASENDIDFEVATSVIKDSLYHIKHGDTLQGIAFRLGIDARELCRLNKLPPSTMNTTPHLLHTRTSLVLPAAARIDGIEPPNVVKQDPERQRSRAPDDPELVAQHATKAKEMGGNVNASLEGVAIAQYLDDEEWEQRQRQARTSTSKPPTNSSRGWWRRSKS
ncbi:LysM domain-containing protein [Pleurotus pulmonarius]